MTTSKTTTLVAKTLLNYGGRSYGAGMQFVAGQAEAAELIKAGQADEAPPKGGKAATTTTAAVEAAPVAARR